MRGGLHHRMVKNFTISIITLIAILLSVAGCQARTQVETDPTRLACIEMMRKVPVHYEDFEFWDVKALRNDPDLSEMYQVWHERRGEWLASFGISDADVEYVAEAEVLTLATGNFSLEVIRDSLKGNYERNNSYEIAEVWSARKELEPQTTGGAVTLDKGLFAWGNDFNIDDYLSVKSGKELTMYDKSAAVVLERLPPGIEMRFIRENYLKGLTVSGTSYKKEANKTLRWTNLYKFESAAAAGSDEANKLFKSVEEDFDKARNIFTQRGEPVPFSEFSLEREGEFVEWSILVEEKYAIALLFYG